MKRYNLLTEESQDIEILTEQTNAGKQLYIQGIFAQAEILNGNKRKYSRQVMESAVQRYNDQYISKNRAIGELNHPDRPFPDVSEAAIRITEMKMDGNNVIGKAIVLNTPKGQIIKGLLEGGFALGVSTRGLGSLKEQDGVKMVQSDFMMTAVDAVDGPSAPDAVVNHLYESTQWMLNESTGVWTPVNERGDEINEQQILEKLEQLFKGKR